jgi:uncharacterized protein
VTDAVHREAPPVGVVVRDVSRKGCRVYAARAFAEGETVERAPVIVLTPREHARVAETVLGAFAIPWTKRGAAAAVSLGYGAVYRASGRANAQRVEHAEERVLEIVARRPIAVDDEITVAGKNNAPPIRIEAGRTIAPPDGVYWGDAGGRGRGVFAAHGVAAGETIECSPCIGFAEHEWKRLERTVLDDYAFLWGDDLEAGALPLGYGALYNHSFECNACYVRRFALGTMDFVAVRDIAAGEEIRTNYNRNPANLSPVWFDVV